MLKTALSMLIGALAAAAVSVAMAGIGIAPAPTDGWMLIEGKWLFGVTQGVNFTYQSGLVAHAGGTQAACLNLLPSIYLYEVDTVATTGDSVCIPLAKMGTDFNIRNAGAQTLYIYGQATVNPATGVVDTINGTASTTAYQVPATNSAECFAAKTGVWSCTHGS